MLRFALLTAAGCLYFLGQVGIDIWPLSLVAFVPALWALDPRQGPPMSRRARVLACLWMGLVPMAGGYYWVVETLEVFSGFPWLLCLLFAVLLWLYQGGSLALVMAITARGVSRGHPAALVLPAAVCACELLYPQLFGWYMGNALHELPLAIQIADLGGPLCVSALLAATNGAIYDAVRAGMQRAPAPRATLGALGAAWAFTLAYGAYRIQEVDARAEAAEQLQVGLVQANMGIFAKRDDVETGLRRHVEQSLELEREGPLDLLVWPETAFGYFVPEEMKNLRRLVLGPVRTPTLFGGLSRRRPSPLKIQHFNTAFLTDAEGDVVGTYDKTYLLAFGEFIPFGETFPELYEISPNSGRFTPGSHVRPVSLGDVRLSVLVCYEDIIPTFVRAAVREGDPHVLVNITNDAWFGDTAEPWQHLALAKFRAVEHHRALLRSTNSGPSTAIDPVGRVIAEAGVMERASLRTSVPLLTGQSVYARLGDWPGWVGLLGVLWMLIGRVPSRRRT